VATAEQRTLAISCDGLSLEAGAIVPEHAHAVVVLLHGIPSTALPDPGDEGYPGFARDMAEHGFAAVWADMRGARRAQGYFSIEGWVRDARAVVDAARNMEETTDLPVALVGSSAGGAVAAEAIRRGAPVDALVLLAAPAEWLSFASDTASAVRRITAEAGMPLAPDVLADPSAWASEFDRVSTEQAIAHVRVPILIVHGGNDLVVPVEHARRIAGAAPGAELHVIAGGAHQLRRSPEAISVVVKWLERRLGPAV
jgi:uncharacterized protein